MSSIIDLIRKASNEAAAKREEDARTAYPQLLEHVKEASKHGKRSCKFPKHFLYKENVEAFRNEGFKVCFDGREKVIPINHFDEPNPWKSDWTVEW